MRRRLRKIGWMLCGIFVVAIGGLWGWLNSASAARFVGEALADKFGGVVRLDDLSVGLGRASVARFRLTEQDRPDEPWLRAERIDTDLGLCSLISGSRSPGTLWINDAAVLLRFDRAGKLLTTLPKSEGDGSPLPSLHIANGTFTIRQEGKPDAIFNGINGTVREEEGKLLVSAAINDPAWGRWRAAGEFDAATLVGPLTLTTESTLFLKQALLNRIPFVDEGVWREVQINGNADARVRLEFNPPAKDFRFLVDVQAKQADVNVPAVEVPMTDAVGHIVIERGLVRLSDVKAAAAAGVITLTGMLDFREPINRLELDVRAAGVSVQELPPSWDIQKILRGGTLEGAAKIRLEVPPDGPIRTDGDGKAVVHDAKLFNTTTAAPVVVFLKPTGGKFTFQGTEPPAKKEKPNWSLFFVKKFFGLMLKRFGLNAKPLPPNEQGSYVQIALNLKDIDLKTFLAETKVELPLPIAGRANIEIIADIPTDKAGDLKAYRVQGTATFPSLKIGALSLEKVSANVKIAEGLLTLDDLRFQARGNGSFGLFPGSVRGSAKVGLFAEADLGAKLILEQFPLRALDRLFPDVGFTADGSVFGELDFVAPSGSFADPTKWSATARLTTTDARLFGLSLPVLAIHAQLRDGLLKLQQFRTVIEGSVISLAGDLHLKADYAYRLNVGVESLHLEVFDKLIPKFRPPIRMSGFVQAQGDITGTLFPLTIRGSVNADGRRLLIEGVPIDEAQARIAIDDNFLMLNEAVVRLADGELRATATYPLQAGSIGRLAGTIRNVNLDKLAQGIPALSENRVVGTADGTIAGVINLPFPGVPPSILANVDLSRSKLRVRGVGVSDAKIGTTFRNGTLFYRFSAKLFGGTIGVDGQYPATKGGPAIPNKVSLNRLRLEPLLVAAGVPIAPEHPDAVDGLVSMEMQFTQPRTVFVPWLGRGILTIDDLTGYSTRIAERISADLFLTGTTLAIKQLSARIGPGVLRGSGLVDLLGRQRGYLALNGRSLPTQRLLAVLPEPARDVEAEIDLRALLRLGPELRGTIELTAPRGSLADLPFTNLRIPIDLAFTPATFRGRIRFTDVTVRTANGTIGGDTTYELFGRQTSNLVGQFRITNVNPSELLRAKRNFFGIGTASGTFEFSGTDVQRLEDLRATVDLSLGPTRPTGFPILREIFQSVAKLRGVGSLFEQSKLRATLHRGVWRLETAQFVGRPLLLTAEGTIAGSGNLNLQVTATTGMSALEPIALAGLLGRLPSRLGPIPIGLIIDLSRAISNRTVHLSVTGTVGNPNVRVDLPRLLSESAVRFFLGQAGGRLLSR